MNVKILANITRNLNNSALEGAIEDCIAAKEDPKKLEILLEIFRKAEVIVPVSFPKDADRTAVMKILQGKPLKPGENVPMVPISIKNSEGQLFAPVFTSGDKIKETKDFPHMIRITTDQVIRNVQNEALHLDGVIINPQGQGFIIRSKAFGLDFSNMPQQQQQVKKVSKEEFTVLARNSVEKAEIPKRLFAEKGDFIAQLQEGGTAFLCELYSRPYGDKVPSPYTEDDFGIMELGIDDDTTAFCLELPAKGMNPQIAVEIYIVWKSADEEAHYYLIEKGVKGENDVLCNVTPEGTHQELMTAPPTGSELTSILELIEEGE